MFNVNADASGLLTPTFDLEPPHYDGIESLALHGNVLFSGSRDAAIKKWNLARDGRQEVMLAQAHKDWVQVSRFRFSFDPFVSHAFFSCCYLFTLEYYALGSRFLLSHCSAVL